MRATDLPKVFGFSPQVGRFGNQIAMNAAPTATAMKRPTPAPKKTYGYNLGHVK